MDFYFHFVFLMWINANAEKMPIKLFNFSEEINSSNKPNKFHIYHLIVCDKHTNQTNISVIWIKRLGLENLLVRVNTIYITDKDKPSNYTYECKLLNEDKINNHTQIFFEIKTNNSNDFRTLKIINDRKDLSIRVIHTRLKDMEFDYRIFKTYDKDSIIKNPMAYVYIVSIFISIGLAVFIFIFYILCYKADNEEYNKIVNAVAFQSPNYEIHAGGIHNENLRNVHGNTLYRGEDKRLINYADPKCPCHTTNIPYNDGDKAYFGPEGTVPIYPMQDKNKVFTIPSSSVLNIANHEAQALPVVKKCKFNHTINYENKLMGLDFKDIHSRLKSNEKQPAKFKKLKRGDRINVARAGPDFRKCDGEDMRKNLRDPIDQYFDDLKNEENMEKESVNAKETDKKKKIGTTNEPVLKSSQTKMTDNDQPEKQINVCPYINSIPKDARLDQYIHNVNAENLYPKTKVPVKYLSHNKCPVNYINRSVSPTIPSSKVIPPGRDAQRNPLSRFPPACSGCPDQYIPGFDGAPALHPAFENARCQYHVTGKSRRPNVQSFSNTSPPIFANFSENSMNQSFQGGSNIPILSYNPHKNYNNVTNDSILNPELNINKKK